VDTRRFEKWAVEYNLDGAKWELHVMAPDAEDAMRRLKQAATWGHVAGREVFSVKIAPDWVPRFYGWVRNKLN
jgi:hypothetical protein